VDRKLSNIQSGYWIQTLGPESVGLRLKHTNTIRMRSSL